MTKTYLPRMKVKSGSARPNIGLFVGDQFVYLLLGFIDGHPDQVVLMDLETGKNIPGVNINNLEFVK